MSKQPLISYERVEHEAPRVLVFRLSGKLHGSPRCFEFLEDVRDEVRDGRRSVVIDFAGLDMMNSTGVGIVAACYTSQESRGHSRRVRRQRPDPHAVRDRLSLGSGPAS